jgi:hypothetical protein
MHDGPPGWVENLARSRKQSRAAVLAEMTGIGDFVPGSHPHNALSNASAPNRPPAAATPALAESNGTVVVVVEEREVIAERLAPATFGENANVKSIYFDFDR